MTHNPAAIIRKDLGTLKEDALADIAIFDEEEEWVGVPAQFHSKGKNSVFKGKTLKGKAVHTLVGGR
jgi:dihydroorotase